MSAPTAYWQHRAAASPIRYPAANSQPGRYAGSHPRDQLLDPLVDRAERVLAQHGPLSLVVQLEVDPVDGKVRSEEHTSELQSQFHLVCRLLLEKKKSKMTTQVLCT